MREEERGRGERERREESERRKAERGRGGRERRERGEIVV